MLKPTEISEIIKQRIENFESTAEVKTEGTILSVKDGIVQIYGIADAMFGEMLQFTDNSFGIALNLEPDSTSAVILGASEHLQEGQTVRCTGKVI